MKELQLGVLKGYDADMFRPYAPDVKSFMESKEIPNAVTVCVGKISHPGHSSYQREVDVMKSLVPENECAETDNIHRHGLIQTMRDIILHGRTIGPF